MPYDYRTVKDQYDMLYDAGVVTEPLEKWSAKKNLETGTDAYSAGLEDNWIKRVSVGVDRFLESTGLPGIGEQFGGAVGGLIGAEEAGAAIGKSLPRTAASMLPFLIPVAGVPLGTASMAASAGAEAYTATGSPASGLIAAGTAAAMPGVGNIARQAALKGMGVKAVEGQVVGGVDKLLAKAGLGALTEEGAERVTGELVGRLVAGAPVTMAKEYIPRNLAQGLLAGTAENVAGSAVGFAGGQLESVFSGQPYEFSPTTELLNMTVGQLPFAALSATRHGRAAFGGRAAREHEAKLQTSVDLSEKAITQHRLNEEATGNPLIDPPDTPEQIAAREARVTKLSDLREKQRLAKSDETTVAESERQKLSDEDNAILGEQGILPGHILGVPMESIPKRPMLDPTAPSEDSVIRLNTAEQQLAAAKDNVDLQDSIVEINDVRSAYGMKPLDDVEISFRQGQFNLGSNKDSIQSHIDETRRLATAKEEGIALRAEIKLKEAELTHVDPMVRASAVNRLNEIQAARDDLDNVSVIADAPTTRDSAPIKNFTHEQAVRISESTPEVVPGDQQKFLDWVSGGSRALMQKHGMSKEATDTFINDNPVVASWRNRLEVQVKDGVTLQDYAERHLKNQGVMEEEAKRQSALVTKLANAPDLTGNLLATPVEGAEAKQAFAEMNTLLANDPEPTTKIFSEKEVTNADELYNKFVATGKIDEDTLINLDDKVAGYIYAKAREHQQLARVLHGAENTEFVGRPLESPELLLNSLGRITDIENKQAKMVGEMLGVGGVAPKTFMQNVASGMYGEPLAKVLGGATKLGDVWKTPAWIARFGPIWQEFVSRGHQLSPNIRKMSMESFKAFGMDDQGKLNKKYTKALGDKQITGALSKWMAINNIRGSKKDVEGNSSGVTVISADDPEVARVLQGLPAEKQDMVKKQMARQEISTKGMHEKELLKRLEVYTAEGTKLLNEKTGFKYDQNLKISGAMLDLAKMQDELGKTPNPELEMKAQALEQQLLTKIPKEFTELRTMMGERLEEYNAKKEFYDRNPAWATSQGYGKYTFTYLKGKKEIIDTADSRAEARDIAGDNQIRTWERNLDYDNTPIPEERDIPPELADARWFRNHLTWLNKNATYWSRALYRAQSDAVLSDPETSTRPDLKRLALQHRDNMLSADPKFGKDVNKLTSLWYLGFNPASAMANGTQLIVRGAAELTKLTGNPIDSYRRIINSYKTMYDMWMPGGKGLTDEHQKVVNRLEHDGVTTLTDDLLAMGDEDSGADLKRILSGRGPLKTGADNLARIYKDWGMGMFRKMERVNNIGAVLAAYDFHKGKGLDHENAYKRALEFNQSVNDVGGKANRPIEVMKGTGEVSKSLGLMATSMQTYNIGTVGQIAHYIKEGFFTPKDLTPGEKYHHKMALANLLGAQFMAAGVLGMPFIGAASGIIDQIFPSAKTGERLRDFVNGIIPKFMSDDEDDGGTVADMALLGIPSMFGWDMQSRLSMANPVAGIDEINGFQPELLLGVPGQLAGKFVRGGIEVAQGKGTYVGNMMPPILKRQYDSLTSGGKVRDYNGKPILNQPTAGEKLGLALGFQPTKVSEHMKANRAVSRSDAIDRDQDHTFNQNVAQDVLATADFGVAKRAVKARLDEAQAAGKEYDWVAGMRKITDAAEALYFPNDLRRKLSPNDAAIAKHFQISMNEPTEAARSRFKEWMLTNLGVPYKAKDRAKYELMDRIEAENPGQYTRTEKRRLAEKAMGKVRKVTPELAL